ncbi:MAG: hypothetical protein Kow0088_15170 [Anaerolineales bacterium]
MIYFVCFLIAFTISLLVLLILINLLRRFQVVDQPRSDRWHRFPTPRYGGIGIFIATLVAFTFSYSFRVYHWENFPFTLLFGMVAIFIFGLIDDLKSLTPVSKLILQVIAASIAVFFGHTTNFFSPRIGDTFLAQVMNSGISLLWLVAITNAMNLIDNMDGLAGGIALIICLVMSYIFWDSGDLVMLLFASGLAGAILGFLILNFPPAKIFMGDSGSQFLGYTLALLAIARQPQASNVFAIIGVPALLFTLPLADTLFVTITRWLRGKSPFTGGKDHTSHRLIAFGLSERQALLVLYTIALIGGIVAIVIESLNYTLSLFLLPIIIVSLLIFTTYLADVRITESEEKKRQGKLQKIIIKVFLGRSFLEVCIDGILISSSFFVAVSLGVPITQAEKLELFTQAVPLAIISGYLAFYLIQIYRDMWRHLRAENVYRYLQAAVWAAIALWVLSIVFAPLKLLTPAAAIIFGVTLFAGLILTRYSFRALDSIANQSHKEEGERVILYAALENLEFLIPFIEAENQGRINLLGLVTDQEAQVGKRVFDLKVLGRVDQILEVMRKHQAQGLLVEESKVRNQNIKEILSELVSKQNNWVRIITLDMVDYRLYTPK